jgi:hypothetical protein
MEIIHGKVAPAATAAAPLPVPAPACACARAWHCLPVPVPGTACACAWDCLDVPLPSSQVDAGRVWCTSGCTALMEATLKPGPSVAGWTITPVVGAGPAGATAEAPPGDATLYVVATALAAFSERTPPAHWLHSARESER